MKKSAVLLITMMLSLGSCSEKETAYIDIPSDAKAGEIHQLTSILDEETGREISTATLIVSENREDANSRLLALPIKIYRSTNPNPEEPVFWLTGGPGSTNMTYWPPDELLAQRDVVLIGYRGIDGTTVLECPEFLDGTFKYKLFSEEAVSLMRENLCDCQNRWQDAGIDLSCYSMTDVIDDLETARQALNYQKINLLSVSYGTRLAQIFAYRHPSSLNRSIMVSVNPPGHFAWNPETIDRQIQHYSKLWAQDSVYSQKSEDLASTIKRVMNHMPERWLFFKIDPDKVRFATFMGLYQTSGAGSVFDTFIAADNGDASGLALVSTMARFQLKKMYRGWGDLISKSYADFNPAVNYNEQMKLNSYIIGSPGTQLFTVSRAWQGGTKDTLYSESRTSEVETLLLSGNIDLSTPAENARDELLPYLPNGKQYILSEYGHVSDIMNAQHVAFVKAICSYYSIGEADMSAFQNQKVDFAPQMSFPQLAKIVIGCVVGVILLIIGIFFLARHLIRRRKLKKLDLSM